MSEKTGGLVLKRSSGSEQNNKMEKKAIKPTENKSKSKQKIQGDHKSKVLETNNKKLHTEDVIAKSAESSSFSAKKESKTIGNKGKEAPNKVPSKEKQSKEPVKREDVVAIDDMFSQAIKKKRLNEQTAKAAKEEEEAKEKRYKQAAMEAKRETALFTGNPDPKIHRWDKETGLPVYKYYDLRMGEPGSGFTPLCPFDCSCCY